MQRSAIVLIIAVTFGVAVRPAGGAPCPVADVRAAVDQACPCAGSRSHGQYLRCVRKEIATLRKQGCDVNKTMRCATASICGKPHNPILCRKANGHVRMTSAAKCTAKGGNVLTGVTTPCDVPAP